MAKSQIIWTILPYGIKDRLQRVSVVVSPRLTPKGQEERNLGAFPEFLNWPEAIGNAAFSAEVAGNLTPLKLMSDPDAKLWEKLFNKETLVDGFVFRDMSNIKLRSYPIRSVLSYLKEYYSKLAVASPSDLPQLLPWADAQSDLKEMLVEAGTRAPEKPWHEPPPPGFDRFFDESFIEPPGYDSSVFRTKTEYDLYLADRFYRRSKPSEAERRKRRPDFEDVPKPPMAPEYDFHRIIASLADYPELMRRLGLVLDFALSAPITDQEGKLRLRIKWRSRNASIPVSDVAPWTAFLAGPDRFMTRPRTNDQKDGFLNLKNSNDSYAGAADPFDVYQVDPDGAALKTVDFIVVAQSLNRQHFSMNNPVGAVTYTTGDKQGLAALRSGGLGVSRNKRAQSVIDEISVMTHNNDALENGSGDDIVLFAEDVFRGYRVDVADEQKPDVWRTLNARVGDYKIMKTDEKIASELADEGYVNGISTTSDDADSNEHYLHESLFRWTGWSLSTPRPGRALKAEDSDDGSHIQRETSSSVPDSDEQDAAKNGCGVSAVFTTAKGSLPRLRFGHLYRLRARIVDIAGNSLALDAQPIGEFTGASDAVGYWRFEPIDPPVIVHRHRVSEGESLERMVIRSDYNISAHAYFDTEQFKDFVSQSPASNDFHYGEFNERHLLPPKSSQQQCETHGLFEPYSGNWQLIKKGYEIAAREEGSLYDGLGDPASLVELVTPSSVSDIATTDGKPALPDGTNPTGDRMVGGQYVIHGKEQICSPWLPDGAAGGTAIRAAEGHKLPGVDSEKTLGDSCVIKKLGENEFVILVSNGGKWPESKSFRLILAEMGANIDFEAYNEELHTGSEPKWNEQSRTLTLFVPKGRIVRLLYSSFAEKAFIESFGIPQWVQNGVQRQRVLESALTGSNWLIAPFRELTLVHATQKPVFAPKFNLLWVQQRKPGDHDIMLLSYTKDDRGITLHGPSTGKFEIEAKWFEWVDDIAQTEPKRVEFNGQLGEINLPENHGNGLNLGAAVDAQLSDPKAKRADVHAVGDTRFRLIEYRIRATTRFQEYLPQSFYANPDIAKQHVTQLGPVAWGDPVMIPPDIDTDAGAPIPVGGPAGSTQQTCILSTAPPADPPVLYIVPTMRWQRSEKENEHGAVRYGNGLRVWLDRPWFSSGDGELLGVVVSQADGGSFKAINPKIESFVTQWGRDPFWNSPLPKSQAIETDFSARVTSETLRLQEYTSEQVMVIGHRVYWNSERRLWYCDIELNPLTTYMPFVRLALVRYQPNSIDGAKISKVILADFAQVLPNRRATVKIDGNNITAALSGPYPRSGPMDNEPHAGLLGLGRNRVEIVLQTRNRLLDSDLAWEDTAVLASQVIGGPVQAFTNPVRAGDTASLLSPLELDKLRQMQAIVSEEASSNRASKMPFPLQPAPLTPEMIEQPFWEATVQLPVRVVGARRLMLREFERYYQYATDTSFKIEERLIFADIIEL